VSEEKEKMDQSISLKGIQYIVDDSGKRTAVVISLEEWGELWEDIYDALVSEARKEESTIPWETLKAEIETDDVQS
jgi:hypothetical protein